MVVPGMVRMRMLCVTAMGLGGEMLRSVAEYIWPRTSRGQQTTVGQYTSSNPIMVSYAVIGASRGIGLEYVRQLVSELDQADCAVC